LSLPYLPETPARGELGAIQRELRALANVKTDAAKARVEDLRKQSVRILDPDSHLYIYSLELPIT
jgi:predicted short-subunit dehydrogenase-like oxidoreductase (DUF2520 family)